MKTRYLVIACAALSACGDISTVTRADNGSLYTPGRAAPADAAPGTCWDKTETPAVVETLTEDILVQPAQISNTGTVQSPPIYRSQTRQIIVSERQENWFQIVCPADLGEEYVASVQRALDLRGKYRGVITGKMDPATRDAIASFQRAEGIKTENPGTLTIAGARKLGLWTAPRQTAG